MWLFITRFSFIMIKLKVGGECSLSLVFNIILMSQNAHSADECIPWRIHSMIVQLNWQQSTHCLWRLRWVPPSFLYASFGWITKAASSWEKLSSEFFDQLTFKPACSATEASWNLETLDIASMHIILSKQRKTKVLIRLCGCAGWSAPLLFVYGIRHIFSWPGPNGVATPFNFLDKLQIFFQISDF